jgi:hypothetical protein
MKNIKKISLATLIALLSFSSVILAEVTSAELSVKARAVDFPEVTLLSLNYRVRLNEIPGTRCIIRLFGSVSEVGEDTGDPERQLLATKRIAAGSRRLTRFSYYGRAVSGAETRQTQGNFQARIKCAGSERVTSNVEATNLTCYGGVARRLFLDLLANEIE